MPTSLLLLPVAGRLHQLEPGLDAISLPPRLLVRLLQLPHVVVQLRGLLPADVLLLADGRLLEALRFRLQAALARLLLGASFAERSRGGVRCAAWFAGGGGSLDGGAGFLLL